MAHAPGPTYAVPSLTRAPVQRQLDAAYPVGPPDSPSAYQPEITSALVTAVEPVTPEIREAPRADSVQSVGCARPPLSLTTYFTSVRCPRGLSLLVIVQTADAPGVSLRRPW